MIACTPFVSTLYPLVSFLLVSLVVVRCVCVAVVLLLHHLGPLPVQTTLPYRSSLTSLGIGHGTQHSGRTPCCWLFFVWLFFIRYGRVQICWLFCTANFLQNRGDTTAKTLARLTWRTRGGNVDPSKGGLYLVDKDRSG